MYYIHLSFSIFLTAYTFFAFKKYTGTSKFPFRAPLRHYTGIVIVDHVNGVRPCLWTPSTNGPVVHPKMMYEYGEPRWNDVLTGENRRTRRKPSRSSTFSTTNPTWIDTDANPGFRGARPVTNDLSHGTAGQGVTYSRLFLHITMV